MNHVAISSFRMEIISVYISECAIYKEVLEYILEGFKYFNRSMLNMCNKHEYRFHGDDFRDAVSIDRYKLSNETKEILNSIEQNYDYYDVEYIILNIPQENSNE